MDAPPPGASGPPGPPVPGPARVDPLAALEAALVASEAALVAREAAAAASEAASAALAHWAQGLATWALRRLPEADIREYEARGQIDLTLAWRDELLDSIAGVRQERDRLHDVCARLAEEEELMRRESALGLSLGYPPLAYPLIDIDSPTSDRSIYSPVPPTPPPPDDPDPLA